MAHLQYKNLDIIQDFHNFYYFTSKKREYNLIDALEAVAIVLPHIKGEIEDFNKEFLDLPQNFNLFINKRLYYIPIDAQEQLESVDITNVTQDVESFLLFKDTIIYLNEKLIKIQEKLKKYEDKNSLTKAYLNNHKFRVLTTWECEEVSVVEDIIENDKRITNILIKKLTKKEKDLLKDRFYLSLRDAAMFKLLSIADFVDMTKNKNPFTKILKTDLYQSSKKDFNYKAQAVLEIPNVKIYFLAVELENQSNPYRWVSVKGYPGSTMIDYHHSMEEATPLNNERVQDVINTHRHTDFVCCEYDTALCQTRYTKNKITDKFDSTIEKNKLSKNLVEEIPVKKRVTKI